MNRSAKLAIALSLGLLAVMSIAAGLVYASVCHAGVIGIEIQDRTGGGQSFSLEIPAAVVSTLASFLPQAVSPEEKAEADQALPLALSFFESLEQCPDGPFVLVEKGRKRVEIAKRGPNLVISVEEPKKSVRITSPLSLFQHVLESLDSPASRNSPVL